MTDGISLGRARCTGRSRTGLALSVVIGRETRWIPTSAIHELLTALARFEGEVPR